MLAGDERVHLITREHGLVLAPAFVRAGLMLAAAGAAAYAVAGAGRLGPARPAAAVLGGLVAALALMRLVRAVHGWHMRRLVVTDRRLLLLAGGITRQVAVLPLGSIETVEARCAGVGRLLRYGRLTVTVNGRRTVLFGLRKLPDPDLLLGLILGLDDHVRAHRRLTTWAPRVPSPGPAA